MRNPKRIKPYCDSLVSIWNMVPDWQLSQLMKNALNEWTNRYGTDPFYVEDEDFIGFLFEYISKLVRQEDSKHDCRDCKYGKFNDHWNTHFCYHDKECHHWELWEPKEKNN